MLQTIGTRTRLLLAALLFAAAPAIAQQQINLTSQVRGILPIANGGTNAASASGTALDNISGFASTGFLTRTGAGAYSFQSTTNGVTLGNIAQIGTNTVLGNSTSGTANASALSVGGCSSASSALIWTTNTGFGCNTSITANTASTVTTNANLTGPITSSGNATAIASQTGTGTKFVMDTSPTIATPVINSAAHVGGTWVADATWTLPSHTLSGTVSGTPTWGSNQAITLSTAAQPNITSVGTLTSLAVSGAVTLSNATQAVNGGTSAGWVYYGNSTGAAFLFFTGPTAGTANSAQLLAPGGLSISNAVTMPGLATSSLPTTGTMCWTTGTGNINVDTTTTCLLSSAKYKQAEKPLTGGLRKVLALRPVAYTLREQYNPAGLGEQIGLLAEDVAKVDSRLVSIDDTDGTPHAVRYQQLTAVLAKAIQEQQTHIRRLERRLAILERQRPIAQNAHLIH